MPAELDFDSTVEECYGEQEGAVKGHNTKCPGRPSHHPLLAFVSEFRMIANFWLRPGNTSASGGFLSFLEDTLEKLSGKKVGLIRMDSGFFSNQIMSYLEEKDLNYIIACRFNNRIKHHLAYQATEPVPGHGRFGQLPLQLLHHQHGAVHEGDLRHVSRQGRLGEQDKGDQV